MASGDTVSVLSDYGLGLFQGGCLFRIEITTVRSFHGNENSRRR